MNALKTDYVKEIITDETKLGDRSVEIDPRKEGKQVSEIVISLKQTMKKNDLVSLSAPQIGYNKRICCFKFGDNDYKTLVNPIIEHVDGLTFSREKCSSLPGKEFIRPRYAKIRVIYMTPMAEPNKDE
jgi:peptide deformylase